MAKNKLETLEILFLCAIGVVLLGMLLPWIKIPLLGSFSALNSMWGVASFFVVVLFGASFFWKKDISQSGLFVLSGLFMLLIIERIISLGSNNFNLDLGFLSQISIFNFLGMGLYITIIASSCLFIFSSMLLKKNNPKGLTTPIIILVVLFTLILTVGFSNILNLGIAENENTDFDENVLGLDNYEESLAKEVTHLGILCSPPENWDSDAEDDGIAFYIQPLAGDETIVPIEGTFNLKVYERVPTGDYGFEIEKGKLVYERGDTLEGNERLNYFNDWLGYKIALNWDNINSYSTTSEDEGILYVTFTDKEGNMFSAKEGDNDYFSSCQLR